MFRIILLYGVPGALIVGAPLFWGMVRGGFFFFCVC